MDLNAGSFPKRISAHSPLPRLPSDKELSANGTGEVSRLRAEIYEVLAFIVFTATVPLKALTVATPAGVL